MLTDVLRYCAMNQGKNVLVVLPGDDVEHSKMELHFDRLCREVWGREPAWLETHTAHMPDCRISFGGMDERMVASMGRTFPDIAELNGYVPPDITFTDHAVKTGWPYDNEPLDMLSTGGLDGPALSQPLSQGWIDAAQAVTDKIIQDMEEKLINDPGTKSGELSGLESMLLNPSPDYDKWPRKFKTAAEAQYGLPPEKPRKELNMSTEPVTNTDRELWRETPGDYYASSIHVTRDGSVGINVGGTVFVKSLTEWHNLAARDAITEAIILGDDMILTDEWIPEKRVESVEAVRKRFNLPESWPEERQAND
jgi:hypothetical protein